MSPGRPAYESETTIALFARAREGDRAALDVVAARLVPRLRRWATGRLPRWARDLADTADLVQDTVVNVLGRVEAFEPRHEAALTIYLRQALANRLRNELRRVARRPAAGDLDAADDLAADDPSPFTHTVIQEALERYELCLARLSPEEREAIIGRLEFHYSYQELAEALGKPSADATRKTVERAVQRLAHLMNEHGTSA